MNILPNILKGKNKSRLCGLLLFLLLLAPIACTNDAPPMGKTVVGRDSLPVMVTRGVSKLITDSGVIRYKIITEEWRVFDRTNPPRWEFPKGLYLERYDNQFKVDLRFTADSAWLYQQKVWKMQGNVAFEDKASQTRLRTQELFWNMQTGEMWSDVYTTLKQPQQEIQGTWFRATLRDGRPTKYHVRQSSGFMPMGDMGSNGSASQGSQPADTASASDSVRQQPLRGAPQSHPKTK